MKKRLWLAVSAFLTMSIMSCAMVVVVFFWNNQTPSHASGDDSIPELYYQVNFNTCGGSRIDSVRVLNGGKVLRPEDPKFDGCDFVGWFLDSDYQNEFNFDAVITQNLTLYAKWNAVVYTVTFDSCGGEEVAVQKVFIGQEVVEQQPVWDDYEFFGWYTDATYTHKFDFETPITKNLTLYAKWTLEFELSADGQSYGVKAYNGTRDTLVIPGSYKGKTVTYIGEWVFENCQNLTVVEIKDGISRIDRCAFYGCCNLTVVVLPDSLTPNNIDKDAFRGCSKLDM